MARSDSFMEILQTPCRQRISRRRPAVRRRVIRRGESASAALRPGPLQGAI